MAQSSATEPRGEPDGRFERRLAEAAKRKKKRAAALATMTPEQRQAADAWARTHKPGPAADRAYGRQQREAAALFAKLSVPKEPKTPEEWCAYREGLFG